MDLISKKQIRIWSVLVLVMGCAGLPDPLNSIIDKDPFLAKIANDPVFEVQVIYTQIDRDESQNPTFTSYSFNLDSSKYFYPASTVKFPTSLAALEKINKLNIVGLTKESEMVTDSAFSRQTRVINDSSSENLIPSIGHYIKKIFLVSDNDAYNRLYEFLGQDELNRMLYEKDYADIRLIHRLSLPRTVEENLHSNPLRFFDGDSLIYEKPLLKASGEFLPKNKIFKGVGFIRGDTLINEPMEFTYKNRFPMQSQHDMIVSLFFPKYRPEKNFDLTEEDLAFVYKYMGMLPRESGIENYAQNEEYYDAYVKFFLYGSEQGVIPDNIRIFSKSGLAYGYALDNAYIVDFDNDVEFFLTAVVHTNENQIFNDGVYEYDEIAFPFLKKLGEGVYEMELNRKKKVKPDFKLLKSLF